METADRGKISFVDKLRFLKGKLSQATDQYPFLVHLTNPQFITFDGMEGILPTEAKAVGLIKRNKLHKNSDLLLVQIGPYETSPKVAYACFPIRAVKIKDDKAVIDCAQVVKEGFATPLPNFFIDKSPN